MKTSPLVEAVAGLDAPYVIGRRTIDPASPVPFTATMRNDFMTPRGTPYKWQDMRSTLTREVSPGDTPTVAHARYTWQDVAVRTASSKADPDTVPWTQWNFARGQSFTTLLLHSAAGDGYVANGEQPGWGMADVRYPDLPKSPAVDLLLMLSWDVLLFEVLCTNLGTTAALERTGVIANLDRHSGTGGALNFSSPTTASYFRNSEMFAVKLGYGTREGRPTAVYTFSCLDCELTTRVGPTVQKGRSSYWGMVQIDLRTSDLVLGEFTEVIVGTFSDGKSREVPIYRRRLVRLQAGAITQPGGVPAATTPDAGERTLARGDDTEPESAAVDVVAEACARADRVYERVREHVASLDNVAAELRPMADIGFRTVVGTDHQGALDKLAALREDLANWVAGAPGAASRLATDLRLLEGLLAYCKVSVDEGARLSPAEHAQPLKQIMMRLSDEISGLVVALERLEDGEEMADA